MLGLVCAAIMMGSMVAAAAWSSQAWTFGLLGGCALAFFLCAWWNPPALVENWQLGAWGEEATEKVLRPLERAGWVVMHDLAAGRGNVDHVVVGPAGIFILDSKRLGGSVSVSQAEVTVSRLDDPDLNYHFTGTGHLLGLAHRAHDRLAAQTKIQAWVQPVIVFWADFPQRIVEGRCAYVHGDELADWLLSLPQRIAPSRVIQHAEALRSSWEAAEELPALAATTEGAFQTQSEQ